MKKDTLKEPQVASYLENLFLLSGAAALTYQICWQRILFFSFGTDIESTTIIVAVFMFGLGLGALGGGWAADRWTSRIIPLFAISEIGIGLFGLVSPHVLPWASTVFILSDRVVLALVNFALLLLPTALMGATLPMLVTYCMKHYKNIGVSTGSLYCMNTLGAALGCGLTGAVGFDYLTLQQVIALAACVNVGIALTVVIKLGRRA